MGSYKSTQEILLTDKCDEARYNLYKLNSVWKDLHSRKNIRHDSIILKYEFNGFVNSLRSITFVLQKCYKNKHPEFEYWYSGVQDELRQMDFAQLINKLRVINQKEGNKFPDLIEINKINEYFNAEITLSPFIEERNNILKKEDLSLSDKLVLHHSKGFDFVPNIEMFQDFEIQYDNSDNEENLFENMIKAGWMELQKRIMKKKTEIKVEEISNMSFLRYDLTLLEQRYSWKQFIHECKKILTFLENKCNESCKMFN